MQPVPESADTLIAQHNQLVRGERRAQMFPGGKGLLPLVKGMRRIKTPNGDVFHFDPKRIKASDIVKASKAGRENDVLDLGPVNKHEALARARNGETPVAVTERDPHGTEVRAAAGTHRTAPAQVAAMNRVKSPGHSVQVEHPGHTIARRFADGGGVKGAVDRTHDVPFLAGSSNKGHVTYIDRRVPHRIKVKLANGKGLRSIDPAIPLAIHEQTEHAAMRKGMSYEDAHDDVATPAEREWVKARGLDWKHYEQIMGGLLSHIEHERPTKPPKDLYLKPYPHDKQKLLRKEAARNGEPSQAQKEAGNYKKEHTKIHGLDIAIENGKGTERSGVDKGGKTWSVKMPAHYGYIKRTEGADGDHVDAYIGPHPKSPRVFIVNQQDADSGKFDEHKVFLGFGNAARVRKTYNAAFSDGRGADRLGSLREMSVEQFKEWLRNGDTTKKLAAGGAVHMAEGGAPEFDPGKPFEEVKSAAPAFDPSKPFEPVEATHEKPSPSWRETAADVAKSSGIGVAKGMIGLAGLPGDVAELGAKGIDAATQFAGRHLGMDLPRPAATEGVVSLPGSADIQKKVEGVTGEFYKPKTTAGEYAQTAGEFAPAIVAGPGGLARRAVTQVVAPAAASETAGQLTHGTAAEPYARVAGALAGGVGASRLGNRTLPAPVPTTEQIKDAARAGYHHPEVAALEINPASVSAAADNIVMELNKDAFRALGAPQTYGIVAELKAPVGPTSRIADIDSVRKALNRVAANYSNPTEQAAANAAIAKIDDYVAHIPQADIVGGNLPRAQKILDEARANWTAAKHGETMGEKLTEADRQAAATYSGGNLDNATRQKLKSILNSKKLSRGYTGDELAEMEKIVRGTFGGNVARAVGKLLGGGGGLGSLVTAAEGAHVAGPGGFALPLVGMAGRAIGAASTTGRAAKLEQAVRARSPEAQQWQQIVHRIANQAPSSLSPRDLALLRAVYASPQLRGILTTSETSP